MTTFKALLIAQVIAAALIILIAALFGSVMVWPVSLGILLYGLPTFYVDLQQARYRNGAPYDIVQGFYKAGSGKFILTLCGFVLVFSKGLIQYAEGIFLAYAAMWLAHTMASFVASKYDL